MKKLPLLVLSALLVTISCKPITGPRGYAIIFGVSLYDGTSDSDGRNLKYTDDDARSIKTLLESQGWNVQLFLDDQATKTNLTTALAELAGSSVPVLFYFSGHGIFNAGTNTFYFVPYDGYHYPSTFDYPKMVTPTELDAMFSGNDIKHGMAILDSCNSGGFVSDDGTANGIPSDYEGTIVPVSELMNPAIAAYASYAQSDNIIVLSAAGAQELSWESSGFGSGHGIFTYYLLESAQFGDYDKDGFVSTVEAYAYTSENIEATWNQSSSSPYLPHFSGEPRDYLLFKTVK